MKWNKGEQQRPFHKSGSTEDAEALTMRHSSSTKLPLQACLPPQDPTLMLVVYNRYW